jgi:membrane-bound ClpP family serine protease
MLESNIINMGLSILSFAAIAMAITRFLPKSPLFRRLILDTGTSPEAVRGSGTAIDDVYTNSVVAVGDTGRALNELRPVGKILINDSQLDAQSEGEFIEKGVPVRVVRVTGNFIFVRKIEGDST